MDDFKNKLEKYRKSTYFKKLKGDGRLSSREDRSLAKINELRELVNKNLLNFQGLNIFAAGSLGRLDSGDKSDLDVFFTSSKSVSHIEEIHIFFEIIKIAKELKYPEFSNDGQYLKIFLIDDIKSTSVIGSPVDDQENWFTTRMLLLLESQWIFTEDAHKKHLEDILKIYFRDTSSTEPFRPIFLINDILRFWRTLCLNYEQARHKTTSDTSNRVSKPWRKKNYNLKFSRMLSIFGTIIPLILVKDISMSNVVDLCSLSPIHRLVFGLYLMDEKSKNFEMDLNKILSSYNEFLILKESNDLENPEKAIKDLLRRYAEDFHIAIVNILNSDSIPIEMRRYLLV